VYDGSLASANTVRAERSSLALAGHARCLQTSALCISERLLLLQLKCPEKS